MRLFTTILVLLYSIPVMAQLPSIPGFLVEEYASLEAPAELSIDPNSGDLYVGSGVAQGRVRRIASGGGTPIEVGPTLPDPDSVLFLPLGFGAIPAGSLLCGGSIGTGQGGQIVAILPDESTLDVLPPTLQYENPSSLDDRDGGDLLIVSNTNPIGSSHLISMSAGSTPTEWATFPEIGYTVRDSGTRIFVSTGSDVLEFDPTGSLVGAFLTDVDCRYALAIGPETPSWPGALYVVSFQTGELLSVSASGSVESIGSGFAEVPPTDLRFMAFGPDGALYVSEGSRNQIVRIVPGGFIRGDCNRDQMVDISDPVRILEALFASGPSFDCDDACDGNDDGAVDISDAVSLLNLLFVSGPRLLAPYPNCGSDPTGDALGCAAGCP